MSDQREWSLDNLSSELRQLRESLEQIGPLYRVALDSVAYMPVEFGRRWWSSRVDMLMQRVRVDYAKYMAQAQEAGFNVTLMAALVDSILKAGGMEPAAPPASLKVGISISALGKIEPTLLDDPLRQSGVLHITFEHFEATGQRLKREILKGKVIPKNEEEIPGLIFARASQPPGKSPGK